MVQYFRTLLKLLGFFLEDEFLFLFYPKDDFYYPAVKVTRQLLKNHICQPFKAIKTIDVNSGYAVEFQDWILMGYRTDVPDTIVIHTIDLQDSILNYCKSQLTLSNNFSIYSR